MPVGQTRSGLTRPGLDLASSSPGLASWSRLPSPRLLASALPGLAIPFVMALAGAPEVAVLGAAVGIVLSHCLAWHLLVAPPRAEVARIAVRLAGRERDLAAAQRRRAGEEEDAERLAGDSTGFALRLGRDRKRRWVSPACRAVLGVPPATVLARGLDGSPTEAAALQTALDALSPGESTRLELPCRRADGGRVLLAVTAHHIGDRGFLLGARDITRERQLEIQVAELTRRLDTMLFEDRLAERPSRDQSPSGTSDLIRSKTRLRTAGSVMR